MIQVSHTGRSPSIRFDTELFREHLVAELGQTGMQSTLLHFQPACMQITQSPWDSQGMQPVSAVMPDLACDSRHRVAADAVAAASFITLKGADQPEAALLHQIVAFTGSVEHQTVGTEMGQAQVHQNSVIALQDVDRDRATPLTASLTLKLSLKGDRWCAEGHR